MKKLLYFIFAAILVNSCSTEVDLLDDWKETTIVYGLLDQNQPKQYVRIQKAFLGPGNALLMAQEFDSINYVHQLDVKIEAWNGANQVTVYSLQPDTITNKDAGIFNSPNQVIYSFDTPPGTLNPNYRYRLIVTNTQTGNIVKAETGLIENNMGITQPSGSSSVINMTPTTVAPNFDVKWTPAASARRYDVGMKFYYYDIMVNGDTVFNVTNEWTIGNVETNASTALVSPQIVKFDKLSFYRFIGTAIPDNPNVVFRIAGTVEFTVYAGDQTLKEYIEINGASNSVSQDRPIYTNIENGYGVFASRTFVKRGNLSLLTSSLDDYLCTSTFTCALKFRNSQGQVPGCQ